MSLEERTQAALQRGIGLDTKAVIRDQAREIERLTNLLRSEGANRYWEGRWRDEAAENQRLRAALSGLVSGWGPLGPQEYDQLIRDARKLLADEQSDQRKED